MGALCVSEQKKSISDEKIKAKLALKKDVNGLSIYVYHGDILEETVDAIVTGVDNSGNSTCMTKSGKPAKKLEEGTLKIQGSPPGKAFNTSPGNLKSKHLILIVLPTWRGGDFDEAKQLKEGVKNVFALADDLKLKSLSFGELSSGINSIPVQTLATVLLQTTIEYSQNTKDSNITTVNFIHMDNKYIKAFSDELENLLRGEVSLHRPEEEPVSKPVVLEQNNVQLLSQSPVIEKREEHLEAIEANKEVAEHKGEGDHDNHPDHHHHHHPDHHHHHHPDHHHDHEHPDEEIDSKVTAPTEESKIEENRYEEKEPVLVEQKVEEPFQSPLVEEKENTEEKPLEEESEIVLEKKTEVVVVQVEQFVDDGKIEAEFKENQGEAEVKPELKEEEVKPELKEEEVKNDFENPPQNNQAEPGSNEQAGQNNEQAEPEKIGEQEKPEEKANEN